jgi:DNA-binding transcriptional LysR family regulator
VDPDDLSGHAVIGFHRSLAEMPAARWLAERCAGASIVLRSREAVDLLTAVRSGAGLAVLPCFLGDEEPTLVRLTPEPIATRRLSLVYRRDGRLSPELRAVASLIVESLRGHAQQLRGS